MVFWAGENKTCRTMKKAPGIVYAEREMKKK